jgi:hypothetical protein
MECALVVSHRIFILSHPAPGIVALIRLSLLNAQRSFKLGLGLWNVSETTQTKSSSPLHRPLQPPAEARAQKCMYFGEKALISNKINRLPLN